MGSIILIIISSGTGEFIRQKKKDNSNRFIASGPGSNLVVFALQELIYILLVQNYYHIGKGKKTCIFISFNFLFTV